MRQKPGEFSIDQAMEELKSLSAQATKQGLLDDATFEFVTPVKARVQGNGYVTCPGPPLSRGDNTIVSRDTKSCLGSLAPVSHFFRLGTEE